MIEAMLSEQDRSAFELRTYEGADRLDASVFRFERSESIHVWRLDLESGATTGLSPRSLVSPGELARAERFVRPELGRNFLEVRAVLRVLLGRYLSLPPGNVEIVQGPAGKPGVSARCGGLPLHFNVSHSGSVALLAFTRLGCVGVDVEVVRPEVSFEGVLGEIGTVRERDAFASLGAAERLKVFFGWWTRKEALAKAVGLGLSLRLDEVEVGFPGGASELELQLPEHGGSRWTVWSWNPSGGMAAALAVEGQRLIKPPLTDPGRARANR